MNLEGKVVLVAGTGPGLGRRIAAAALRDGASVVLGARSETSLAKIADELDPSGERVAWQAADVRDPELCRRLAGLAADRFGKLDALVSCAALDSLLGGIEHADWDRWRETFDIIVFGTMQMTQAALPYLRVAGGAIVFIASQTMFAPPPQAIQTAYAASKGALLSAMYHLAQELGPSGIRVNTVVPGWMWGPSVQYYVDAAARARGVSAEQVLAGITKDMPLGQMATDADVAEAVLFFASDHARAITGQSLLVNAGEVMR